MPAKGLVTLLAMFLFPLLLPADEAAGKPAAAKPETVALLLDGNGLALVEERPGVVAALDPGLLITPLQPAGLPLPELFCQNRFLVDQLLGLGLVVVLQAVPLAVSQLDLRVFFRLLFHVKSITPGILLELDGDGVVRPCLGGFV